MPVDGPNAAQSAHILIKKIREHGLSLNLYDPLFYPSSPEAPVPNTVAVTRPLGQNLV